MSRNDAESARVCAEWVDACLAIFRDETAAIDVRMAIATMLMPASDSPPLDPAPRVVKRALERAALAKCERSRADALQLVLPVAQRVVCYKSVETPRARYRRGLRLRRLYGVSLEWFEATLTAQRHLCACCRERLTDGGACVDHDHGTGEVRGILCHNCNIGIGKLGDTLDGLQKAVRYLQDHATATGRITRNERT